MLLNPKRLREICLAPLADFARYGDVVETKDGLMIFSDRGADILAIAHLDTVLHTKHFQTVEHNGEVAIINAQLDDRLGAYILLDVLPRLGVKYDLLLTDGEERGLSTASFFVPPRTYRWMFQFDRAGTDVVMYDYETDDLIAKVAEAGAFVGLGSFSDICYLDHVGCRGVNWGTGYYDNHLPGSYALWSDTLMMIGQFISFWKANRDTYMPYDPEEAAARRKARWYTGAYTDDYDDMYGWDSQRGYYYRSVNDEWTRVDPEDLDSFEKCPLCGGELCLGVAYCEICGAPQHNDRLTLETGVCAACDRRATLLHRQTGPEWEDSEREGRDG